MEGYRVCLTCGIIDYSMVKKRCSNCKRLYFEHLPNIEKLNEITKEVVGED